MPGSQNAIDQTRDFAVNAAIADPEVTRWLNKGYEISGVYQHDDVAWVHIMTQEQQLQWVVGISLRVPVSLTSDLSVVNFELTLANMTESQKEQTLRIAKETSTAYGGTATTRDAAVSDWTEGGATTTFYAYSCITFRVPEDLSKAGQTGRIFVDLEKDAVTKVWTYPEKPLPPPPPST